MKIRCSYYTHSLLSLCIILFLGVSKEAFSQEVKLNPISIGVKVGASLTSFEHSYNYSQVIKPVFGIYANKYLTPRLSGQIGVDYASYASKDAVPPIIAEETLRYIQLNAKAHYLIKNYSGIPVFLGGGIFAGKLTEAMITSYDVTQAERTYFKDNATSVFKPINVGFSLSGELRIPVNRHQIVAGVEYTKGLSPTYKKTSAQVQDLTRTKSIGLYLSFLF